MGASCVLKITNYRVCVLGNEMSENNDLGWQAARAVVLVVLSPILLPLLFVRQYARCLLGVDDWTKFHGQPLETYSTLAPGGKDDGPPSLN